MYMKHATKISLGIALIVVGALFIWKGPFIYKNFRGAATAFIPAETGVKTEEDNLGLQVPEGFRISIFAKDLGAPRVLARDGFGNILVSIPKDGVVLALADTNSDGIEDKRYTLVQGLNKPHGLAVKCDSEQVGKTRECKLYVAEENRVASYTYNAQTMRAEFNEELTKLPTGGRHTTRTLMWDPQNQTRLLVSIGSSCDVCIEKDEHRASIWSLDTNTKEFKLFAKGLRNAVFMATNPVDGKVWATEMGRDYLGDNAPPDELNIIEEPSTELGPRNYGWPNCYGKNIHDTAFDKNTYIRNPCMEPFEMGSTVDLQAHSAPLGIAFVPADPSTGSGQAGWSDEYWYNALVAYHGSWNRTVPTGYSIARVKLNAKGEYQGTEPFITGWLEGKKASGRPVDIILEPGGTGYISDDKAGVIYRLARTSEDSSTTEGVRNLNIKANDMISSPLKLTGELPGTWYFEAVIGVAVTDARGKVLVEAAGKATREWTTTDYVPFEATLNFAKPTTPTGFVVIKNDNPSGLPENDKMIKIPVKF